MRTRLQGVQDEAPHVPQEPAEPGRFGQGGKAREPADLWRPWVSGSAEGGPGCGGSAANQVQAWQKALPRREGDQQATIQDSGPCGKCDPPGQNLPDHGGQIPKSVEKVRPHQRYRVRTCQPKGALEGGSSDLTRTTRKIWAEDT